MKDPNYKTQTYQYHRDTYGENFNYDDFAQNFTAHAFDAKEWVDLIADAGARYMVPVTSKIFSLVIERHADLNAEHHDGFALYNFSTTISKRSSIWYGPKRDFLAELFTAAKKYQPQIKRGILP